MMGIDKQTHTKDVLNMIGVGPITKNAAKFADEVDLQLMFLH